MALRPASDGTITGTGTLELESTTLGGVLVSTDGTNAATVIIKDEDNDGETIISYSGKEAVWIDGTFDCQSGIAYYSISGTGASAQIFKNIH